MSSDVMRHIRDKFVAQTFVTNAEFKDRVPSFVVTLPSLRVSL